MDIVQQEKNITARIEALRADIEAIQQPRSDFAIKHFVVGQHDTPARQRQQAVLELQIKLFNIRRAQIEEQKLKIQQARLRKSQDELDVLEAERLELDEAEMRLARMGAIREAEALLAIVDALPKFTYEEYQEAEAEYWARRLSRQALQDLRATGTISVGNLEAIRQATAQESPQLNAEEFLALAKLVP